MDPVSLAKPAVALAVRLLDPLTTQAKFERARDEQMREWQAELDEQVRILGDRFADLVERVTETEERLFHGTIIRFTPEAIGALTPDHRSLLAVASAGVLRSDFDVETKSRIIRALNALEPGDVVHLRTLAAEQQPVSDPEQLGEAVGRGFRRIEAAYNGEPARLQEMFREEALRRSMCLDEHALVTPFGRELVRYVELWRAPASALLARDVARGP